MSLFTTKPVEELTNLELSELLLNNPLTISPHAYDHLSGGQRKIFKDTDLISMVTKEKARKIYLQENGRYRVYYRRADGYREIILAVFDDEVIIVSFMDPNEIPKVKF